MRRGCQLIGNPCSILYSELEEEKSPSPTISTSSDLHWIAASPMRRQIWTALQICASLRGIDLHGGSEKAVLACPNHVERDVLGPNGTTSQERKP